MGTDDCCCGRFTNAQGTRIIAIASAAISALGFVIFTGGFIHIHSQGISESELNQTLDSLPKDHELYQTIIEADIPGVLREQHTREMIVVGVLAGVSVVSFVVALLLLLAVRKSSRWLALPYMIWTILCTAAGGMFGIVLLIALPHVRTVLQTELPPDTVRNPIVGIVIPFCFIVILFKLYTWWLIVVFNFYNRIKFSAGGPPFDAIPMQTQAQP